MIEGYHGYHERDALDELREQEDRIRSNAIAKETMASRERQAEKLREKIRKMGYKPCA